MQHNDARFLELLQRWQSGDFTRADERELNALTASDNFRREAMEGFMSQPEAEHDERLASLRLRLQKRMGGGRLIAMPQILAAAAVFVLLIAALLFFPKWNENDAASPVAQTQSESRETGPFSDSADMIEGHGNDYIAATPPVAKPAPGASGPYQPAAKDQALSTPGVSGDVVALEESESVSVQDDAQPAFTFVQPQAPNAAPASAQPQSEALDKIATGAGKNQVAEPVPTRTVDAAKAKKSATPGRAADSAWHETDRKPDMEAEKKAARDEAKPKESEPEGGWEAFSDYLRQNARLTADARNHNTNGTVQLQFNLNNNGDPQGFLVLRSVGYGCDQEAIRLVQNWEWVRGLNPIVTVEVPFVR